MKNIDDFVHKKMNNDICFDVQELFGDFYFFFDNDKKIIIDGVGHKITFNYEELSFSTLDSKYYLDTECTSDFLIFLNSNKQKRTITTRFRKSETSQFEWYAIDLVKRDETNIYMGRIRNVNENVKEREEILRKGYLDPLTKILQKEAVKSQIMEFLVKKPEGNHIMIMLDIDYFKNINDTYGHLFGDYVIKATANALKKVVGSKGKVGRVGGDEFLLFIKNVNSREEIKTIARQIRYALDNLLIRNQIFRCSSTLGITSYPKDGEDFETLFKKADIALYRGKIKGRDCHIIYDEELHGKITRGDISSEELTCSNIGSRVGYISEVLETLLNTKNINESILCALDRTGNFFNLHKIAIYDLVDEKLREIKSWTSNKYKITNLEVTKNLSLSKYLDLFISDNLAFFNDSSLYKSVNRDLYNVLTECHVSSGIAVLLFENEKINGLMFFFMQDEKRVWSRDEIFNLSMVAKIFNIFVNRLEEEKRN